MVLYLPRRKIVRDMKKYMRLLPDGEAIDISKVEDDRATRLVVVNLERAVAAAVQEISGVEIVATSAEDVEHEYFTTDLIELLLDPTRTQIHKTRGGTLWKPSNPHCSDTLLTQVPYDTTESSTVDFFQKHENGITATRIFPNFATATNDGKIIEGMIDAAALDKAAQAYMRMQPDIESLVQAYLN